MTRVVTVNIQARMSLRRVLSDLRTLLRVKPDVILFQEIGGKARFAAMMALLRVRGFRGVWTLPTPMAYRRRRYRRVSVTRFFLSPATNVGREGAGPTVLREKEAAAVVLRRRRSRRIEVFVNAHLAPSPYLNDARATLHATQVQRLAEVGRILKTRWRGALVVLGGDWNTPQRWRLRPIADEGFRLGADAATHGRRQLDYLAANRAGDYDVVRGLNTDHNALVGRF